MGPCRSSLDFQQSIHLTWLQLRCRLLICDSRCHSWAARALGCNSPRRQGHARLLQARHGLGKQERGMLHLCRDMGFRHLQG